MRWIHFRDPISPIPARRAGKQAGPGSTTSATLLASRRTPATCSVRASSPMKEMEETVCFFFEVTGADPSD